MATKKTTRKAKPKPVLSPLEQKKQAAYERRQALRIKQGIAEH